MALFCAERVRSSLHNARKENYKNEKYRFRKLLLSVSNVKLQSSKLQMVFTGNAGEQLQAVQCSPGRSKSGVARWNFGNVKLNTK
jgi:hypothetical protein